MFCHNKPLFRARLEGPGRLAHLVYCALFLVFMRVWKSFVFGGNK